MPMFRVTMTRTWVVRVQADDAMDAEQKASAMGADDRTCDEYRDDVKVEKVLLAEGK